jgi:predicted DNA binding CopG/RHH family protein
MKANNILKTRVTPELKQRVQVLALREQVTESIWLRRAIDAKLRASDAAATDEAVKVEPAPRESRISVRLRRDDLARLADRAGSRGMPTATYVAVLIRAHLKNAGPLPTTEVQAMKHAICELVQFRQTLNPMVQIINETGDPRLPGRQEVFAMLKICEALRDYVRFALAQNFKSWRC